MEQQYEISRNRRIPYPFACLPCRRSFKRLVPWNLLPDELTCPHCGGKALLMSRKFKPPARGNIAQWKKVEALIAAGFRFYSTPNYAPYPDKLRDVPDFVRIHS